MTIRQLIPEGLAQTAPGPDLGAALAGLDLHALAGSDLVDVLCARARQLSHEQAQLLAVMAEVGYCDPHADPEEVTRLAQASDYAADEIRAALAWTRNAAYREYHFDHTLLSRLPTVFTALDGGVICRSKAWLFTELCAELTDEQAQLVCDRLLPDAGRLTTGELAVRIKKLVIALDPDWAARRYARAVRDRDVIGYLDEDGAATVTGRRLPAEQAAAACARIENLAKAAKRAGHPGRIGPLRADIYLGLLDGRWAHHTREEIITDLLAQAGSDDTPQNPAPNDTSRNVTPEDNPDDAPAAEKNGSSADQLTANQRIGVELRVGLSTLLGHDRHSGEIPGWGPITAETARTLAATQRTGEWRYALTDPDGQLILAGVTRARPTMPEDSKTGTGLPTAREGRGGIVELHLPAALLTELATHPHTSGAWAAVIADLAAQYATHHIPGARGGTRQDPAVRFAGAALRRHVQIRDRVCVYPGCRCPARHADLDHGHGGLTTDTNSGPYVDTTTDSSTTAAGG
ncbi:MAG: DUF222 domain-containing protein [Pseudonocardiaceae bacterium]